MSSESVSVIRGRAELARRLADELHTDRAKRELLEIAAGLEAEAARLEQEAGLREEG